VVYTTFHHTELHATAPKAQRCSLRPGGGGA